MYQVLSHYIVKICWGLFNLIIIFGLPEHEHIYMPVRDASPRHRDTIEPYLDSILSILSISSTPQIRPMLPPFSPQDANDFFRLCLYTLLFPTDSSLIKLHCEYTFNL